MNNLSNYQMQWTGLPTSFRYWIDTGFMSAIRYWGPYIGTMSFRLYKRCRSIVGIQYWKTDIGTISFRSSVSDNPTWVLWLFLRFRCEGIDPRILYTGLTTHVVEMGQKTPLVPIVSVRRVSYAQQGDAQCTTAHPGTMLRAAMFELRGLSDSLVLSWC